MVDQKLLTSGQAARLCSVDIKTIHNWINRGAIVAGRTPGNQVRIHPDNLRPILNNLRLGTEELDAFLAGDKT